MSPPCVGYRSIDKPWYACPSQGGNMSQWSYVKGVVTGFPVRSYEPAPMNPNPGSWCQTTMNGATTAGVVCGYSIATCRKSEGTFRNVCDEVTPITPSLKSTRRLRSLVEVRTHST